MEDLCEAGQEEPFDELALSVDFQSDADPVMRAQRGF